MGSGKGVSSDKGSLLGEDLPAHASPRWDRQRASQSSGCCSGLSHVAGLLLAFGPNNVFSQIARFFSKMAMVTFGGAYAVLAYVAQQPSTIING